MKNKLKLQIILPVKAKKIYSAWLDSLEHSAMTGGSTAIIDPRIGGKFSAWDGYIFGVTLKLEPFHNIEQSWRTTEFPQNVPDSHLEVRFKEMNNETIITLIHTNLPENQVDDYQKGWEDFYFKPMQTYFSGSDKKY